MKPTDIKTDTQRFIQAIRRGSLADYEKGALGQRTLVRSLEAESDEGYIRLLTDNIAYLENLTVEEEE